MLQKSGPVRRTKQELGLKILSKIFSPFAIVRKCEFILLILRRSRVLLCLVSD